MFLVKWLFVCLLAALTGRLGAGVELGDELDSLLCPAMKEMKGKIIDVHKSLDLGATLLDGSWAPTRDQCASQCCHKTGCDLALYKNEGLSQSGKNCYYIKCGSLDKCVMVNHSGFTSIQLQSEYSYGVVKGDSPNRVGSNSDVSERTGHVPPSSAVPAPSTKAPPTVDTPTQPTTQDSLSSNGVQPVAPSKSDSGTNQLPSQKKVESDHGSTEAPPTTNPAADLTEKSGEIIDSKSALGQGKGQIGTVNGGKIDCGKHGCDGSGVIAIAVVGSICFVIIVLVVTVLLRKVINDNRRRRFKNVDYLINGMYT